MGVAGAAGAAAGRGGAVQGATGDRHQRERDEVNERATTQASTTHCIMVSAAARGEGHVIRPLLLFLAAAAPWDCDSRNGEGEALASKQTQSGRSLP